MRGRQSTLLFIVACWLSIVLAAEAFSWPHWGGCPNLSVEKNFKVKKYLGQWFEHAGYNTESVGGDKRCVYAIYSNSGTEGTIVVENRGISNKTNEWGGINGTAVLIDPSKHEGKLRVTFHVNWWLTVHGDYWVLGTDYKTYSVVYSCESFLFFFHYYTTWFLGRDQTFASRADEEQFFLKANTVLKANGIDPSIMHVSSQANCHI